MIRLGGRCPAGTGAEVRSPRTPRLGRSAWKGAPRAPAREKPRRTRGRRFAGERGCVCSGSPFPFVFRAEAPLLLGRGQDLSQPLSADRSGHPGAALQGLGRDGGWRGGEQKSSSSSENGDSGSDIRSRVRRGSWPAPPELGPGRQVALSSVTPPREAEGRGTHETGSRAVCGNTPPRFKRIGGFHLTSAAALSRSLGLLRWVTYPGAHRIFLVGGGPRLQEAVDRGAQGVRPDV